MKARWIVDILKWVGAIGFIAAVILFGGCSATELEERCFPLLTAVGYDDAKISYILGFPRVGSAGDQESQINEIQVAQAFANTFEESKSKYEGHLNKIVDYNHLKVMVFEEELFENRSAYEGMIAYMAQTEEYPRNTYICVVDDADDLMEIEKRLPQELGTYLEEFLIHHEKEEGGLVTLGDLIDESQNKELILYIPYLDTEDNYVVWGGYYVIGKGRIKLEFDTIQSSIASKVLRFHVLANSDGDADQALKLKVRDEIGSYIQPLLVSVGGLEDTKQIVNANIDGIVAIAEQTIQKNGYSYNVEASIKKVDFPEKTYGEYVFPAGKYEALQVRIGEGKGQNWWCVLYPNMCFKGAVYEVVEEDAKKALKEVLSPVEYAHVFDSGNVQVRFKLLEYFKD